MGWEETEMPVGEPVLYNRDNSMTRHTLKLMQPMVIDSINKSNVLTSRMMRKFYD